MIVGMKRQILSGALIIGAAAGAFLITSCETTADRISKNPEIYQRLSAQGPGAGSQGQIRPGMSQNAVWLAWGSPDRKIVGNMGGPSDGDLDLYLLRHIPLLSGLWTMGSLGFL